MSQKQVYSLTIHFLNGNTRKFAFRQQGEDSDITRNIESLQAAGQLILMLKNKMVWIPMSSIEHMELTPAPRAWPANTIHGVVEMEPEGTS